jgi:glycosyltransferase involved in cell wall biosynthesis
VKVVFNLLDANVGGGQRVAAGIAEALRAAGHDVGVAVPADGPALPWFTDAGAEPHLVDIVSLRRPTGIRRAAATFAGYDVVYSHTSAPGAALAGAAATRAGRPHVIHQHIYPHFSAVAPVRAAQQKLYARAASRAYVIAVAQHVADAAVAAGAPRDRVTVIPNGVEIPTAAAPPAATGPGRIGQLGRLDAQKGIDIFLDAVERTTASATFALGSPVAEDDFGRALHERARALGVEVVAPASRAFLETLDIVAAPSRYEGHPLTLMEAMALGKPVVAAAIPGVTEMLEGEDAGILVLPENADALATALDTLALDGELRTRLGARARTLITERYALPLVHARIIQLLEAARGPV